MEECNRCESTDIVESEVAELSEEGLATGEFNTVAKACYECGASVKL